MKQSTRAKVVADLNRARLHLDAAIESASRGRAWDAREELSTSRAHAKRADGRLKSYCQENE